MKPSYRKANRFESDVFIYISLKIVPNSSRVQFALLNSEHRKFAIFLYLVNPKDQEPAIRVM
ncbi:hypothetical protein UG46_01055 [Pseudomonas fluorescens]|nr:hypothetical protein UG46_01055 [Pseudomonas fluorescens]